MLAHELYLVVVQLPNLGVCYLVVRCCENNAYLVVRYFLCQYNRGNKIFHNAVYLVVPQSEGKTFFSLFLAAAARGVWLAVTYGAEKRG